MGWILLIVFLVFAGVCAARWQRRAPDQVAFAIAALLTAAGWWLLGGIATLIIWTVLVAALAIDEWQLRHARRAAIKKALAIADYSDRDRPPPDASAWEHDRWMRRRLDLAPATVPISVPDPRTLPATSEGPGSGGDSQQVVR